MNTKASNVQYQNRKFVYLSKVAALTTGGPNINPYDGWYAASLQGKSN